MGLQRRERRDRDETVLLAAPAKSSSRAADLALVTPRTKPEVPKPLIDGNSSGGKGPTPKIFMFLKYNYAAKPRELHMLEYAGLF